jgi:hypothetical protein
VEEVAEGELEGTHDGDEHHELEAKELVVHHPLARMRMRRSHLSTSTASLPRIYRHSGGRRVAPRDARGQRGARRGLWSRSVGMISRLENSVS